MKKLLTIFAALFLIMGWTSSIGAEEKSDQFIIINKSINKLAFYEKGELVKTFSVATGKKTTYTPEGVFKIVNKIKNRPYYTKNIPGGDPRNPLGDRWLGLNARGTYGTTYGIHGNSNESSIGSYVSLGCVRMHNKEVRWLFDRVKVNTPVVITHSKLSFDAIAKANKLNVVAEVMSPIVKIADTPIILLKNTPLFKKPSRNETTTHTLSPQKVTAFEKSGDWYHIKTWFGSAWMRPEQKIVPVVEEVMAPIEKIADTPIILLKNTPLFQKPSLKATTTHTLSPQKVTAFEKSGEWHHIKTWFGDAWMRPEQKIIGMVPAVDLKLAIHEKTALYKLPIKESPSLLASSPQIVDAFEKWENWYHIHSENGDGWINGNFSAPHAVSYEIILPEQMGEEVSSWYEQQALNEEPSSYVWNNETYVFIPRGEIPSIWELPNSVMVEGISYNTFDSSHPHMVAKLAGIYNKEIKFKIAKK